MISKWLATFFAILLLCSLCGLLFYRSEAIKHKSEADKQAAIALTDQRIANDERAAWLNAVKQAQQNVALIDSLNIALNNEKAKKQKVITKIQEVVKNDEAAKSWANTDIPVGVRDALNNDSSAN